MPKKQKTGGGSRKKGRMKASCAVYANRQQRERNKARRLVHHLTRFPDDKCGAKALDALPKQFAKV